MSRTDVEAPSAGGTTLTQTQGWRELWLKEDWWAIWIGLGIVVVGYFLFTQGASLKWIAVTPAKWSTLAQLGADLSKNALRYVRAILLLAGALRHRLDGAGA